METPELLRMPSEAYTEGAGLRPYLGGEDRTENGDRCGCNRKAIVIGIFAEAPQGFLCLSLWDSECFYILSIVGSNNSLPISSESFPLSQEAAAPLSPCPGHSPNNPLLFSFNSFTEKLLKEPGSD